MVFYEMMIKIAHEMQQKVDVFSSISSDATHPKVLDICMAPGGYATATIKHNPAAEVFSVTLPEHEGGHQILVEDSVRAQLKTIMFQDITFFLPPNTTDDQIKQLQSHPDKHLFLRDQPFDILHFDLIFCDGQTLRTHHRKEYRNIGNREPLRLILSQLIMALNSVKEGGTLVIKMHNLDEWETVDLVYNLSRFSLIQAFKPERIHGHKGSFYLICKEVKRVPALQELQARFIKEWWTLCFGTLEHKPVAKADAVELMATWGCYLMDLGKSLWDIQKQSLMRKDWVRSSSMTTKISRLQSSPWRHKEKALESNIERAGNRGIGDNKRIDKIRTNSWR